MGLLRCLRSRAAYAIQTGPSEIVRPPFPTCRPSPTCCPSPTWCPFLLRIVLLLRILLVLRSRKRRSMEIRTRRVADPVRSGPVSGRFRPWGPAPRLRRLDRRLRRHIQSGFKDGILGLHLRDRCTARAPRRRRSVLGRAGAPPIRSLRRQQVPGSYRQVATDAAGGRLSCFGAPAGRRAVTGRGRRLGGICEGGQDYREPGRVRGQQTCA